MNADADKVQANILKSDTEDLLDRVTAYRIGMESQAIDEIERELRKRGVNAVQIADHREKCERTCLFLPDGIAKTCSLCRSPAIKEGWGWHRLMGKVPIFPRWLRCCSRHASQL